MRDNMEFEISSHFGLPPPSMPQPTPVKGRPNLQINVPCSRNLFSNSPESPSGVTPERTELGVNDSVLSAEKTHFINKSVAALRIDSGSDILNNSSAGYVECDDPGADAPMEDQGHTGIALFRSDEPCQTPTAVHADLITPKAMETDSFLEGPGTPERNRFTRRPSFLERKDFTLMLQRQPSLLQSNHYVPYQLLGKGSFGEVWSATHYKRRDEWYALKRTTKVFRSSRQRDRLVNEVEYVAELGSHPNIVKYHRAWQEDGHFFIAMELCTGGTLANLIQRVDMIPTQQVKNLTGGILSGLVNLHSNKLMHLDLKPENLFLCNEAHIKIGDFGLCVRATQQADAEEGDREYMAPELLNDPASQAADIFSTGLILYQMLMGRKRLPGYGDEWIQLRQGNVRMDVTPDKQFMASQSQWMISPEPAARPSAEQQVQTFTN